MAINVRAGDLIAFRGISMGVYFGSGATEFLNDLQYLLTGLTDLTLDALNNGGTFPGTAVGHRRIDVYAEVHPGPFVPVNSTRNSAGNLPRSVFRTEDQPWAGKKVIALGTSITASNPNSGGGAASIITGTGYIAQALRALYCNGINNGVGSSGICWDPNNTSGGKRALSLSATQAELTAAGFSPTQSYEVKMNGQQADLIIFDHGYNDRTYTIGNLLQVDGVTPNMDRSTFYGAYNYLVAQLKADRPTARFCFITPISLYNPAVGAGAPPVGGWANTNAIRTAMLAIASYYNAPILDWSSMFELNYAGMQPNARFLNGPATTYQGKYNPATTYAQDDLVLNLADGRFYISMQASNTGNTPSFPTATAWWMPAGHSLDGTHPDQSVHDRAAKVLYRFLLTV